VVGLPFSLPDQLLLGRSIRGFIRGLGPQSAINPFEGFARGLPGAELFDAELNTSFSDLRKAFGDYDAEQGALNFAVNLTGDILTDPSTWFAPSQSHHEGRRGRRTQRYDQCRGGRCERRSERRAGFDAQKPRSH
jgi:hypothetical protein